MRQILILQWPGSTEADFEALIDMEDEIESHLGDVGTVDGHDFGSGEMNIFIETDEPLKAFAAAKEILGNRPRWAEVRAAFRERSGETYDVLWPPGLSEFAVK
jgi:hypothetical protein